ncbi:MAG: DUF2004 domain-containing protein [Cytophagales bacterium]
MKEINLPFFGSLPQENLKNEYGVEVDFEDSEIYAQIYFEKSFVEVSALDTARTILENIQKYDLLIKEYFDTNFKTKKCKNLREYLEDHIEVIDEMALDGFDKVENTKLAKSKHLLKYLILERIAFFPDDAGNYVTFDYVISPEYSDYILAVTMNSNCELVSISIDS